MNRYNYDNKIGMYADDNGDWCRTDELREAYKIILEDGYTEGLTGVFKRCRVCGASDYPSGDRIISHSEDCIIGKAEMFLGVKDEQK